MTNMRLARIAGLLYLTLAVCGGFSELLVRSAVLEPGDASATSDNIRDSATLVRIAFAADLVNITCFLLVAFVLYELLRSYNATIATAMVVFNAVGVAIMSLNMLNHLAAWLFATGTGSTGLGVSDSDAWAMFFLNLHGHGYTIGQIFFGLWLLPLGYLVYVSRLFPKALGVVVMAGSLGYLADVIATVSASDLESRLSPVLLVPTTLAEVSLIAWLLIKGVDRERDAAALTPA